MRAVRGGPRRAHAAAAREARAGTRALRQRERAPRVQVSQLIMLYVTLKPRSLRRFPACGVLSG